MPVDESRALAQLLPHLASLLSEVPLGAPVAVGVALPAACDFAAEMGAEVAETADSAVREASIVVTATSSKDPLFAAESVRPGTHVCAAGSNDECKIVGDVKVLSIIHAHADKQLGVRACFKRSVHVVVFEQQPDGILSIL